MIGIYTQFSEPLKILHNRFDTFRAIKNGGLVQVLKYINTLKKKLPMGILKCMNKIIFDCYFMVFSVILVLKDNIMFIIAFETYTVCP